MDDKLYRASLFCVNANEMEMALSYLGPVLFKDTYGIGLWMWELSDFPDKWCSSFRYVREIWAQSRFRSGSDRGPCTGQMDAAGDRAGAGRPGGCSSIGRSTRLSFNFLFFF